MTKKVITYLHLSCYPLAAELFSFFMVLIMLGGNALTRNYTNFSRVASVLSRNHLLAMLTTFKIMFA